MKKVILILFLLSTELTFGQIINGGFEVWDTTYTAAYGSQLINLFGVPNPMGGELNGWEKQSQFGKCRTTDSHSGNYALVLHNWYQYAYGWITYRDSISSRPLYLQGVFKYITGGVNMLSQGGAKVTLTRFNGTSNDTIGTGAFFFDSTAYYTPFQVNINYTSALNPDSITIYFVNSYTAGLQVVSHLLYLDDLTLSNTPLQVENIHRNENMISVFPNPVTSNLNIQNNSNQPVQFTFYNTLGEKIMDETLTNKISTVKLSGYSNGIYFYKLTSDNYFIKSGRIVKQ